MGASVWPSVREPVPVRREFLYELSGQGTPAMAATPDGHGTAGQFCGSILGVLKELEAAALSTVEARHDSAAHLEGLVVVAEFDPPFKVVKV